MAKLNVGIIGCGRIGIGRGTREGTDRDYSHAGAYQQHPRTRFTAAADSDPTRLELASRVWGVRRLYRDYREMFREEKLDIVSVCVPDEAHYPVVDHAIQAGPRAIFCEKPFTLEHADALSAVERCAQQGLILAVNHQRRWDVDHQRLRGAIAAGELGEIQQVRGLYSGGFVHVGCQLVDLLRFLIGDVSGVELLGVVDPGTQALDVRLRFQRGCGALLQACRKQEFEVFEVDILGTAGRVQITNFGHRILRWHKTLSAEYAGDVELCRDPQVIETGLRGAFLNAVDDLVQCVESGGEPRCSGREAAKTVDVFQQVLVAAQGCQ